MKLIKSRGKAKTFMELKSNQIRKKLQVLNVSRLLERTDHGFPRINVFFPIFKLKHPSPVMCAKAAVVSFY
jgi:hypothetical protein